MKKLIALLTAAVATLTSAWAADLLVSWEGDFKTESKVGTDGKTYTLTLNDNTVAEDGSTMTVSQAKVPTITLPSQMGQHISVVMKYSGYTTPSSRTSFLSLSPSGCNDVGLTATSEKLSGFWNNNGTEYGAQTMTAPESGLAVLSYSCSTDNKGTFGYIGTINADGTISYSGRIGAANLRFTNASYDMGGKTVNLGGVTNTNSHPSMQNLVIEKVAIFSGLFEANNDATLTGFVWPNYQRWAANPAVLTWADTASGTQAFHEGPWNLFSIKGGADTTTSYTTTAAQLPGQTADITPWHVFTTTSNYKYVAPGYVLRLAPGYSAGNLDASFNNMTFGGLIVEKGATGYTFNSTGDRTSGLGDTRANGGVETWYEIHENLRFHRQGTFTLYGALNFDIDKGKTLDLNSDRTGQTMTLHAASHGALKLHGKGNLKVYNLNASGAVTLDYTDVDMTREDAYVTGTITVGPATTIKLPAMDVAVGDTIKLATTLAGSIDTTKVLVDGAADENILWTIDGGNLVATQAPDVVTIGEDGYVSIRQALAAAQSGDTLTLGADLVGKGETVAAGVTIDLAGHALTGTLDIKAGALIKDGDTVKIDGIATSFDATFDGASAFKFQEESAAQLKYDTTATFNETNDGVYLKHHPYIDSIPASWFNNTAELTLAVVGTMTEATRTTFIHIGQSNSGGYGLLLATGDKKDEVIVAWNSGTTVTEITRMNVANAATSRHAYVVTKKDVDTKTTFTVYLDGMKWKTLVVNRFTIVGGVQVGSDFGGQIYRYATGNNHFANVTGDDGVINLMRLYDRVITKSEIDAYTAIYPYVSPNGSSTRAFAADANWVSTSAWSNTAAGETEPTMGDEPGEGAVTVTMSAASTITINLDADATCETLKLQGEAVLFVAGGEGTLAPTAATIGVPVTLVPAALDLSKANTTIVGDGKIVADYSGYDVASILATKTVYVTGEIDQQAEGIVTLTKPTHTYRTIGDLAYDATTHQYGFTVTPVMVNVTIPSIEHTTVSVAAGTLNCTITEGVASVPGGADITITYAPVAGYHFTAETPVASVTASNVTAETQIDVAGVTPVEINMYTVPVTHVENATTYVSIGGGEFEVVAEATILVAHGKSYSAKYVANEGYMLVLPEGDTEPFKTEGYNYGSVTGDKSAYPVHCAAVKIAAMIGDAPYASIQDALDALVEGETTLADITVIDKTATLPEGYEDYTIDEEGKIVPAAPSKPTVIVTKTTVEGLHAAYTYTFGELTQEQKDYYGDWTADYIVSFNNAVAADTVVLSGQYDGNGEEWVDLTLGAKGANEEFGLIAAALEQTGWTGVTVNFTFLLENVGTFNCGIKNLSEDNEGTEMTVKLVLSKDGETIVIGDEDGVKYKIDATAVQGPTSWGETTPSEVIELPEGATTTVAATEIAAWAEKNGVAFDTETTIPVNALIFNVAPDAVPEDPEAAVAEILEDLAIDVESLITNGLTAEVLEQLAADYPMATFELIAVDELPDTDNAKFRKLKVELK